MGAGSRDGRTAALPPSQFHCLLDELPCHLIPTRNRVHRRRDLNGERPLFLNPQCSILAAGEIPREWSERRELLEKFALQSTIAWVRDPAGDTIRPYWLSERLEEIISRMKAGSQSNGIVCRRDVAVLAAAGILVSEDEIAEREIDWLKVSARARSEFHKKGYAPIGDLIHPFHVAALRRYYRHEIRRGAIRLGDEQSSRRYAAHNESIARFFHHQMAKAVAAIAGEPIKPSYVYFASYLAGAELKKHTDREQCEFSVTLCLDFSPEPEMATSWPIQLETPGGRVTVYQGLGDGLMYRGTRVPHYRGALPAGHTSTSIFFHYVRADFPGSLN